ncbi:MAG: flagellar hook-associated protein FlgK [Pseudomonadota bacterium]
MTISQALSAATSGLSVSSRRAAVVSSNISNALTPGYSRREVTSVEKITAGVGLGVEISGIQRASDPALTASRRAAVGDSSRDTVIADTQSKLTGLLGGPEEAFSFFSIIDDFEQSLSDLRETPESTTQQQNAVVAAQQVTRTFNQIASEANQTRFDADSAISRRVDEVNSALEQIASLNGEISTSAAAARDTSALEDQRHVLIDRVAEIIPVREVPQSSGQIHLITNEGVFLLTTEAKQLEFTRSTVIAPTDSLTNGDLSGLAVEGVDITPGQGNAFSVGGGEIAAQFAVRDEITVEFTEQLDGLAADLIDRFSDPTVDPTLTGGAPGLFTDNGAALADPYDAGLAGRIAVNDAVVPENGGEVWRMRDGIGAAAAGTPGNSAVISSLLDGMRSDRAINATGFAVAMSSVDAAAELSSLRAGASLAADTQAATSTARADGLIDAELEATGVDTDLELQNLLSIEQSYAASARVISVIDRMLAALLEI